MNHSIRHKIRNLIIWLIGIFIFGTVGYMVISDYSFIDALYMTAITVTTTGFGEVHTLDSAGRIFTVFLLFISLGLVTYSLSTVGGLLIDGQLIKAYREKKIMKYIQNLNQHTIICGYGRNGRQAAVKLYSSTFDFVIIDKNTERFQKKENELFTPVFVEGDATQDNILERAGIHKAHALIACLPDDADNLFIVLTARQLNPNLKIVSRASNYNSVKKLKIAGANHVIMPDKIGGEHMATLISMPSVIEFLDILSVEGSYKNNMIEVKSSEFKNEHINQSLAQIDIRRETGVLVIGYKTPEGEYIINPDGQTVISEGSAYIILGQPHQIEKFTNVYLK